MEVTDSSAASDANGSHSSSTTSGKDSVPPSSLSSYTQVSSKDIANNSCGMNNSSEPLPEQTQHSSPVSSNPFPLTPTSPSSEDQHSFVTLTPSLALSPDGEQYLLSLAEDVGITDLFSCVDLDQSPVDMPLVWTAVFWKYSRFKEMGIFTQTRYHGDTVKEQSADLNVSFLYLHLPYRDLLTLRNAEEVVTWKHQIGAVLELACNSIPSQSSYGLFFPLLDWGCWMKHFDSELYCVTCLGDLLCVSLQSMSITFSTHYRIMTQLLFWLWEQHRCNCQ